MNATQASPQNLTSQYLQRLAELYQSGPTSLVLERGLRKLLDYEAEENRRLLIQLTSDLRAFEEEHHLTSSTFYHRYMTCLLYTSPSPRDRTRSRMPSSA